MTDTGDSIDVQNLIESAFGSADGQRGIIVVRSSAVCASCPNQVVSIQTDTDVVDQSLIYRTRRDDRDRSWLGRSVRKDTLSVDQLVPRDADARKSGQIVGRIWRADITGGSNEEEALSTATSTVPVDLILTACRSRHSIEHAVTALEVESLQTDALTQDIVVDLVIGAADLHGRGISGRRNILICRTRSDNRGRSVSKRVDPNSSGAVDILVGAVQLGVVVSGGERCVLRGEGGHQQCHDEKALKDPHLITS